MASMLKMFLGTAVTILSLGVVMLYKFQLKLIYPSSLNDGHGKVETPDKYGMEYEDLVLETKDGVKLHAYLMLHDQESTKYKNKTVVVLCPNAGNIGHSLPIVKILYQEFGYNVFIYSYRGYGKSTGISNEDGLKIDADTAMSYISSHVQLNKSSLILYGRSLGGAVAIYIASKNYPFVRGVVLENTFLSIRKTIPHIFPLLKSFTRLCHEIWNSEKDIQAVKEIIPMLFLSAQNDEIVPPDHMKKLYELSRSTDKKFVLFEGYHHNDTVLAPEYWDLIHNFIKNKIDPIEEI